jgi:hypothetical protein
MELLRCDLEACSFTFSQKGGGDGDGQSQPGADSQYGNHSQNGHTSLRLGLPLLHHDDDVAGLPSKTRIAIVAGSL